MAYLSIVVVVAVARGVDQTMNIVVVVVVVKWLPLTSFTYLGSEYIILPFVDFVKIKGRNFFKINIKANGTT